MALKNNTWKLNQWYDQNVAGNAEYSGAQGIYSWAGSPKGESGRNTQGPSARKSSPTQIGSLTTWSSISGYYDGFFFGATKTDGTLWAWGGGQYGRLGQNNETDRSSPVQIPGTTWSTTKNKFGGSTYTAAAIKTDGTLWTWGYEDQGILGQNNLTNYSSPVQVGSGSDWATISKPPRYFQAAIKTDGTLWMWGAGGYGNLGQNQNGDNHRFSSPVQVPGTTWKLVCGSSQSVSATKTDGTMWAWGRNTNGILGQNNQANYSSPTQVGSGSDWDIPLQLGFIGGGIKTDGTLWSWGYNGAGHLGQNDRTARSSPDQIPGTWADMAASGESGSIMAMNLN